MPCICTYLQPGTQRNQSGQLTALKMIIPKGTLLHSRRPHGMRAATHTSLQDEQNALQYRLRHARPNVNNGPASLCDGTPHAVPTGDCASLHLRLSQFTLLTTSQDATLTSTVTSICITSLSTHHITSTHACDVCLRSPLWPGQVDTKIGFLTSFLHLCRLAFFRFIESACSFMHVPGTTHQSGQGGRLLSAENMYI